MGKSNNSPSMESVVSSKTKWDILPNQNGSARLRSKDDKQYLTLVLILFFLRIGVEGVFIVICVTLFVVEVSG